MMMILAVVATLMHQYAEITRHASKKDASAELRQGLESVRHELMSAVEITSPTLGAGASGVLEFLRVDPTSGRGIPAVLTPSPNPAPPVWDPKLDTVVIKYERNPGGLLVRTVNGAGAQTVLSSCAYFQADQSGRLMTLTGSVQEDKITRSYQVQLCIGDAVVW